MGQTELRLGLGLTLLKFNGKLYLPLAAKAESVLCTVEPYENESKIFTKLRAENVSFLTRLILNPGLRLKT